MKTSWTEWRIIRDDKTPLTMQYTTKWHAELEAKRKRRNTGHCVAFSVVRVKVTIQPTKKRKP